MEMAWIDEDSTESMNEGLQSMHGLIVNGLKKRCPDCVSTGGAEEKT